MLLRFFFKANWFTGFIIIAVTTIDASIVDLASYILYLLDDLLIPCYMFYRLIGDVEYQILLVIFIEFQVMNIIVVLEWSMLINCLMSCNESVHLIVNADLILFKGWCGLPTTPRLPSTFWNFDWKISDASWNISFGWHLSTWSRAWCLCHLRWMKAKMEALMDYALVHDMLLWCLF